MLQHIRPAVVLLVLFSALTGLVYPLAVTGIAQLALSRQANGSLIERNGAVVGSALIGQNFKTDRYFHPRPSAAGDKGYDATNSSGSNLGPTNRKLVDGAKDALHKVLEENPETSPQQVPIDMVTASGSGLDPEISPADAQLQVARVAKARGLSDQAVESLIREHTRARFAGILGERGVNVLELNLALDRQGQQTR